MSVENKLSQLVRSQFPSFYEEEGPTFLAFMEAYYAYMEQEGKMTDTIQNLQSYQDIATTTSDFISYFIDSFLPAVPQNIVADKKLMIKYITQFNQSRGTLAAYRLLFRALYNEDVEVTYPADQILKVSDGDWRKDRYLIVPYNRQTYDFIGKTIIGISSSAEGLVEDVVRRNIRGRDVQQLILSNIAGEFFHLEQIRAKKDTSASPYAPLIEAGIKSLDIESVGAEYLVGDVVELISAKKGDYAKVVVTSIEDLGGTIVFSLTDGGSGYTSSTNGDTEILILGGDGTEPASFIIDDTDIVDKFAISINTNLFTSNTIFGSLAPTVTYANSTTGQMSTFANVVMSAANFGFPEDGENVGNADYRDQWDSKLVLANTSDPGVIVGDSLFGVTSSANATVVKISRAYNSTDVVLHTKGYKKFSTSEKVNVGNNVGTTVGTVSAYYANTIGAHELQIGWIANTSVSPLTEGTELVGRTSGAYGVVRRIVALTANGYNRSAGGADDRDLYTVYIGANNTANTSNQFDTGPMRAFLSDEGLRIVSSNTTVGNVVSTTSNTVTENIYTKLSDSLLFEATSFGTIAKLSLPVGGAGYSRAPTVRVRENNIASLGIGEQYVIIETDDVNWGTGNSSITKLDTNDRISQANTQASGNIKGGSGPNKAPVTQQYANGTYYSTIRVWQDFQQRSPGNKFFSDQEHVDLVFYNAEYIPGEPDNRTPVDYGTARITSVQDEGILGRNATVSTKVGANGTVTGLRVFDSGFAYTDGELVTLANPNRNQSVSATATLTLRDVANSEGYYATSRSQLDTLRGHIQDGRYYQEFSYEVVSPLSLNRYRDYALELVHPAGQAVFGRFQTQSNAAMTTTANSSYQKMMQCNGTISITKTSASITANVQTSNTILRSDSLTNFANGSFIVVEVDNGDDTDNVFHTIRLKTVSNTNHAIMENAWYGANTTSANIYYANSHTISGSSTTFLSEFANNDVIVIATSNTDAGFLKMDLNKVNSDTSANLTMIWTGADISGANAYYVSGSF